MKTLNINFYKIGVLVIGLLYCYNNLIAQPCNNPGIPVFNTVLEPNPPFESFRILQTGLQASNGEYIAIGLRQEFIPYQHVAYYFVRLDGNGNVIADPKNIRLNDPLVAGTAYLQDFHPDEFQELMDITEVFDTNGQSEGYVLSISVFSASTNNYSLAILKLDHSGTMLWGELFPGSTIGHARKVLQAGPGGPIITLVELGSITHMVLISSAGTNCFAQALDFIDPNFDFEATDLIPLTGFPSAGFALAGVLTDGTNKEYAATLLLDANLSFNTSPYFYYDVSNGNNLVSVSAIQQVGQDLLLSGYVHNSYGFVLRMTPYDVFGGATGPIQWLQKFSINDPNVDLNYEQPFIRDMLVLPNNDIVVSTNMRPSNSTSEDRSGLLGLNSSTGALQWAREYTDPFGAFSFLGQTITDLNLANDGGLYAIGQRSTPMNEYREWMLKTDIDGQLSDCVCWQPHPVSALADTTGTLAIDDYNLSLLNCMPIPFIDSTTVKPTAQVFCDQFTPPVPTPGEWCKVYGDTLPNIPTRIKAFDNGVYLASQREDLMGERTAVFTKFDISGGTVLWEVALDQPSRIFDFEYDPNRNELVLVGQTEPLQIGPNWQDNQSILIKVDALTGAIVCQKLYNQRGREHFSKIIYHPNALDPGASWYILGSINPNLTVPGVPSGLDQVVLFNMENIDCHFVKAWEYDYNLGASSDDEIHRGLLALPNGNVIFMGNDVPANDGILVEVNGATGQQVKAYKYGNGTRLDFYDGKILPNGDLAIAGENFSLNQGFVAILDTSSYNVKYGLRVQPLNNFKELGMDSQGRLYVTGKRKNVSPDNYVTLRITNDPVNNFLWWDVAKYPQEGVAPFEEAHLSVTPDMDLLFYADDRVLDVTGTNNSDIFLGSFDLEFNHDCIIDTLIDPTAFAFAEFPIMIAHTAINEPPFLTTNFTNWNLQCFDYECAQDTCAADFSWNPLTCFEVEFFGSATGNPPFTWSWDIDCNGVEYTTQNANHTFPNAQSHDVCLTITDADGCQDMIQLSVLPPDDVTPPGFIPLCVPSTIIFTDPGVCHATYNPIPDDDCDQNPTITCDLTGATQGTNLTPPLQLELGITTVICTAIDASGNVATCTTMVEVKDDQDPTFIGCTQLSAVGEICDGGSNVFFTDPTVVDNCPGPYTITCDLPSGSFFPCGSSGFNCFATDANGNTAVCTRMVFVDCQCIEIVGGNLTCGITPDCYDFTLQVDNLSGAPNPCGLTLSLPPAQGSVTYTVTPGTPQSTITGTVCATIPIVNNFNFTVDAVCTCADGSIQNCSATTNLTPICCESIDVPDLEFCSENPFLSVPFIFSPNLQGTQQMRWYIIPAPCPATYWTGVPYQVSLMGEPLEINPSYYNTDLCVYAEVFVNDPDRPCTVIRSNIATLTRCEPVTCNLSHGTTDFCYDGTPIVPDPLSINISNAICGPYTVDWYDSANNLVSSNVNSYQPPALSLPTGFTGCFMDFPFTAQFLSECGLVSCSVSFRLYDENAPVGTLAIDPFEPQPLCPGEDLRITFEPECAEPLEWKWSVSNDGVLYTNLPQAGANNPNFNTNQLVFDTWYKVERTNGVCPLDEVVLPVDVKDGLQIQSFTAVPTDPCRSTGVQLDVTISPCLNTGVLCDCNYIVEWYKDNLLIHTDDPVNVSTLSFTYVDPALNGDYSGNYYVIVRDKCCPGLNRQSMVIYIDPPVQVIIGGACYICDELAVDLTGMVINDPGPCTYQWYRDGVILPLETNITINTSIAGTYNLEATCGGCVDTSANLVLIDCPIPVSTTDNIREQWQVSFFPNPTTGELTIEFPIALPNNSQLLIQNLLGQSLHSISLGAGTEQHDIAIGDFAAGVYLLNLEVAGQNVWTGKIVKQ